MTPSASKRPAPPPIPHSTPTTTYSPSAHPTPLTVPIVAPSSPTTTSSAIPASPDSSVSPPSTIATKIAPLPPHLARLAAPSVIGRVVDSREVQVKVSPNILATILKTLFGLFLLPFRPLMVLTAWLFSGQPAHQVQTDYVVRVEQLDGTIAQVRIEQDMIGATLDPGDEVAFWGYSRGGILIVQHAYNHTLAAEVILRKR